MPFGAVVGAVGAVASVAGGMMSAKAAKDAASAEQQAIGRGLDYTQSVYGQTQENLQPWIGAGQQAIGSLGGFYGLPGGNPGGAAEGFKQFTGLPSFTFPQQQGNLALNRQLASSGLIGSGAALKDSIAYNQGYASQGLGQYLTGLQGIAGGGLQAAGTLGAQGMTASGMQMAGNTNQGLAQAGGIIGANNAMNNGFQNAIPGLVGQGGAGAPGGNSTSSYGNVLGSIRNWFNSGDSYSGPSSGALIGGQGSPAYLQGQLGLGANQYVP